MKVSSSRARLIPAVLALTGAIALSLAGVIGAGVTPLQIAEAEAALRLEESLEATITTRTAFDAAAKSDALVVTSGSAKTTMVSVAKMVTPTTRPAKRTTRTTAAVSRAASTATGGWKTARVSWYGPGFYGNTMAGGGTLTPTSMVVAHRSMAFGTRIEFNYKGKSCVAVVQDRGPYIAGRVFDLGPGTAQALGFSGVGTVSYRILGK